jgi:hypothetical protein
MKEEESKNVDLREVKGLITNQITYLPIALITIAFLIQGINIALFLII